MSSPTPDVATQILELEAAFEDRCAKMISDLKEAGEDDLVQTLSKQGPLGFIHALVRTTTIDDETTG